MGMLFRLLLLVNFVEQKKSDWPDIRLSRTSPLTIFAGGVLGVFHPPVVHLDGKHYVRSVPQTTE